MLKVFFRNESPTAEPVHEVLLADLNRLYAATAPVRTFDIAAASSAISPGRPHRPGRRRFTLAAASVVFAAAAAVTALPLVRDTGPQPVSAAALIEKARAAAAGGPPYYRSYRSEVSDAGGQPLHQTNRVWAKDATHWKSEIYETDPRTGKPGRFLAGTARDGEEYWAYFQDGEILRVINRDAAAVGRGAMLYSLPASFDEMLTAYSACAADAEVGPGEPIVGRETVKITVSIDRERCPGLMSQTLWIDPETYLLMRAESVADPDQRAKNVPSPNVIVLDLFDSLVVLDELSDGPITDEQVTFVPPSGTWVNYQDRGEVIQVP